MAKKERADQLLVQKELLDTRSRAQSLIMAGAVEFKNVKTGQWEKVQKAGQALVPETELRVSDSSAKDVGRGALKLRKAFAEWTQLVAQATNAVALDIGSSTGGFTQVLLEQGARQVFALDVGTHQLHERLRADSRVLSLEQTHVLKIDFDFFKGHGLVEPFELAVMDVSFISATKVIPHVRSWLKPGAHWVILVKPQFELEPKKLHKGIVKSQEFQKEALETVMALASGLDCFSIEGHCESPITGTDGNVEYLLCLKKL